MRGRDGRARRSREQAALETAGLGSAAAADIGATLKTATIGGANVLTNADGLTLYWFAPDTPTRSNCNGVCAGYWPPVTGTPSLEAGVTGTLGTITRSDGSTQATWNGHPLYTFTGDTKPGQNSGNGKNLSGGVWHEATVSGSSGSGGGGGYGY